MGTENSKNKIIINKDELFLTFLGDENEMCVSHFWQR